VLLKGVNDDVEVMKELMQRLIAARVRPYYLYMCDNVAGVEHFKTNVQKGLEIVDGLRGWTSGLAVPHFAIDAPGGGGKIPLLPEYVEEINDDEVVLRNYRGERYVWKQPAEGTLVAAGIHEPEYGMLAEPGPRPAKKRRTKKRSGNGGRGSTKRKK
jgi:lysine 2,3-aminomutase